MSELRRQINTTLSRLSKAMSRSEAASVAGKASAEARRAKSGGSAFDQATAKANALIAANPGKYGPKGAKGKGKGKAGGKGKKGPDPAKAKEKAAKEAERKAAKEQRAKDKIAHDMQHTATQAAHAQAAKEKAATAAKTKAEHVAAAAAKQQAAAKTKAEHLKQQQAKAKASGQAKAGAQKARASAAAAKQQVQTRLNDAATQRVTAAQAGGGKVSPADASRLIGAGLATQQGNRLVLTQKLAKAFDMPPTWHGWAEITKVDEEQRIVYGVATCEEPDDQPGIFKGEQYHGDIISDEAMREATPDYMQFANIREMHQPIAAGTCVHLDTKGGKTDIAAHVVDDSSWKKVQTKVLKGFSIGGKMIDAEITKIDGIPYRRITKLKLTEISLVDRPANSAARITLYKGADMETEQTTATEATEGVEIAKAADPTKAIALLQQLRNDAENSGDLDSAEDYSEAIRSVLQASGQAGEPDEEDDAADAGAPAGGDDSGLAMDDGSGAIPDVAMAATVGDLRKAHPELSDEGLISLLLSGRASTTAVTKRGAAISGNTMGHLQNAHDSIQKASGGATCAQPGQPNGIAMAASLAPDDLAKALTPAFDGIAKVLERQGIAVDGLVKRLEHLESQPVPGAPAARVVAVEKTLPGGAPAATTPDPKVVELELLKKQRDEATDPIILRWLGDEITKRMIANGYRALA